MSNAKLKGLGLHNVQQRIEILARNTDAFLLEPELLSTVLEELTVVLEETNQQYEELLTTRQVLEEQRQRYQELFDFAPDGYLVTDIRGIIQDANQAAGDLFGVRQEFLVGKPLMLFVANADRRAFLTYITALRTSAQQRNWDLQLKPRHGEAFPAVMTTSAVHTGEGTLTGWRWLLRDITELRRATVLMRSASEAKLDNLRSNFIQMTSHALRTPMTIIITALELLKHRTTASPAQQQLYFDRIQQATWRINALLNDVLLYNDAGAASRPLMPTQLNLEAFCQEMVRAQQAMDSAAHTITISTAGACEAVSVDAELVQQMLDRLLSNAVTYSPAGTTVSLGLQCGGSNTCISVHNEGISIPQEEQAHLFEPFYRSTATEHIPGIGLGLALVKRAVDAHGGEVTLDSTETGVTFKVTLPRL